VGTGRRQGWASIPPTRARTIARAGDRRRARAGRRGRSVRTTAPGRSPLATGRPTYGMAPRRPVMCGGSPAHEWARRVRFQTSPYPAAVEPREPRCVTDTGSTCIRLVVARALLEVTLHTVHELRGEGPLRLSPTERPGHPRAMLAVIRVGRTNAQFRRLRSAALTTAFLEFPAIHHGSPLGWWPNQHLLSGTRESPLVVWVSSKSWINKGCCDT